jgi:hypothetical protein
MNRWEWAEQCPSVPSPLVGEGQGEGYNTHSICFASLDRQTQPTLVPESADGTSFTLSTLSPPLSLSLPHKGGGNRGARTFATYATCLWADFQPNIGSPLSLNLSAVRP